MESKTAQKRPADRPGVFFHIEMGVSWPTKHTRPQTNHHTTLTSSQSTRDQTNQIARRPLLSHKDPTTGPARRTGPSLLRQDDLDHQNHRREHHSSAHPRSSTVDHEDFRVRGKSSNPHGRCAPPPPAKSQSIDTNPERTTKAPCLAAKKLPEVWKALPPTPAPSTISVVDGSAVIAASQNFAPTYGAGFAERDELAMEWKVDHTDENPTIVNDRPTGWIKEMECLATAMMTIDNGFEDQWWNQGTRLVNVAGDLVPTDVVTSQYAQEGGVLGTSQKRNIRTTVDEVSIQSTRCSTMEPVSPISNLSASALNDLVYKT